jgi:hypothetical protein
MPQQKQKNKPKTKQKKWWRTTPKIVKKQAVSIAGNDLQHQKEPSLVLFGR